jgi:hypothetical protein
MLRLIADPACSPEEEFNSTATHGLRIWAGRVKPSISVLFRLVKSSDRSSVLATESEVFSK